MNLRDVTVIVYDQSDSYKYKDDYKPYKDDYKQKVIKTELELEQFLENELGPNDKVCFFIHAMMDSGYNMVEGDNDVPEDKEKKPGRILQRKYRNLIVNYLTSGSAWAAITKYKQRFVFNYNDLEEHIEKRHIAIQRVCEFYEHKRPYRIESTMEGESGLEKPYLQDEENLDRPLVEIQPQGFALDGIKAFIREFNIGFVKNKIRFSKYDKAKHWSTCLFDFIPNDKNPLLSETWNYDSNVFTGLLEMEDLEKDGQPNLSDSTLVEDCEDAIENIRYYGKCEKNGRDHQWEIKMNFFVSLVTRNYFLMDNKSPDNEKLSIATRLYLMHEILHKQFHDLDFRKAEGIGSFPRVIEEADFHADAFAILCEISHQLELDKNVNTLIRQIRKIIRIAMETTLSFGRKGITQIQVRRVNRYLIWLYLLRRFDQYVEKHPKASIEELVSFIIKVISVKPILEITGPEIFVNEAKDRVSYKIEKQHITFREQLCLMTDEKKIIVKPRSDFEKYDYLYTGLSDSNFETLYKFIEIVI